VNTLLDKFVKHAGAITKTGVESEGRAQILERAFHEADIDVVCIQEGRMQGDHEVQGVHYKMLVASATEAGSYGSRLWVRTSKDVEILEYKVHSPRVLEAVLRVGCAVVIIITAHCPHSGYKKCEVEKFWEQVAGAIRRTRARFPEAHLIMGADANGKMGSVTMDAIVGDCEAEEENVNGEIFRYFLMETKQVALNTFHPCGKTWVSSRGRESRIDYITTDAELLQHDAVAWPATSINVSTAGKEDHRVIAATVQLPRESKRMAKKVGAKFQPNLVAMECWYLQQQFQDTLWQYQRPSNEDDTNVMLDHWMQYVKKSAMKVFGRAKPQPRQPWISNETMQLAKAGNEIRRSKILATQLTKKLMVTSAFEAWKGSIARGTDRGGASGTGARLARARCRRRRACPLEK
jgi:hypothetical protein